MTRETLFTRAELWAELCHKNKKYFRACLGAGQKKRLSPEGIFKCFDLQDLPQKNIHLNTNYATF